MDGRVFLLPRSSVSQERTFQKEAKMIKLNAPTGTARASPATTITSMSTISALTANEVADVNAAVDNIDGIAKKKLTA